jgi:hypothetical protein
MIAYKSKERLEHRVLDQVITCDIGITNSDRFHWDDYEHEVAFARSLSADMSFRFHLETNSQGHAQLTCIHLKSNPKHSDISFTVATCQQAKLSKSLCALLFGLSNDRTRRNDPLHEFVRGCLSEIPLHVRQGSHDTKQRSSSCTAA